MSSSIKPLIAVALTGVGSALVLSFKVPSTPTTVAPVQSVGSSPSASADATTTGITSPSTTTSASSSSGAGARYADGTYAGSAVAEPWGTFEVKATISGGELTNVSLVSEPSDQHSSQVNSYAVPQLTQEAVAAQSADIDAVSGATWTSQSYEASLQAALDAAAAAAQQNAS